MKTLKFLFPTKHVLVNGQTMQDYLKLPIEMRECRVWWWPTKWYVPPFALEFKTMSEWKKFKVYTKEHYPVQTWLRDGLYVFFAYTVWSNFKEYKWKIKHKLRNPRKEMRNAVFPSTYWDLQTHIVEFHIQCIIEFVEREKCFEVTDWSWNENVKKTEGELKEAYEYCKTGRDKLQKELSEAWTRVPNEGLYAEIYKEVIEKEDWIKECDTKLCNWVVENREVLWT